LSDRKYRQRGYQDTSGGPKKEFEKPAVTKRENTFGPRPINMPGTRTVSRCAECGALLSSLTDPVGQCPKCGFALHACKQCEHFDPSCRFECNQPIPARISPKDKLNECRLYSIRVMVEKETSSKGSQRPNDARQAFENLFRK
jgi:tRNA(Ile2) C34 agmatinyltransferase TiaS